MSRETDEVTNISTDKVRLGIIGLGAQGSIYAKFISTGMVPDMEIGARVQTVVATPC